MIQDDELSRLFLMAGLGMLGAPTLAQGVSRGGMFALQDLDNQRELRAKRQLADAKLMEEQQQAEARRVALERAKLLQGIYGGTQTQPAGSQRSVVDVPGWVPQVPQAQPKSLAQKLYDAGFIKEAEDAAKAQGAIHGEAYGGLQVTKDGRPYYMTKQGPRYASDNTFVPREELHFGDTGDRTNVGFDKFTGAQVSPGVTKGMSAADRDASARWWANFNQGTFNENLGGFVTPRGFVPVQGLPQGKSAREDVDNLRKEFNALPEVKNFKDVAALYNAAAKAPDNPAGDFALIYGVGKILDPGSVVREGEMNMVIASGSPAQRVAGYLSFLQNKGRLTPEQRIQLQGMLRDAATERQSLYQGARDRYGSIAQERGYKPESIFIDTPTLSGSQQIKNNAVVGQVRSGAEAEAMLRMIEEEKRRRNK